MQAALVLPVFVFAFFPVFRSLVYAWINRNDYSHGFVVPFVCLYFVWESRARLGPIVIRPAFWSGTLLLAASSALVLAGAAASIEALQQVSILVVVPALVLLLLGWRFLQALALPLAYLVFMIPPLFDALIGWLHWPFQLYSAATAAFILKFLGVPVHHNAQYLELPSKTLEVARACSGVRFLVSIVALGIPLAFLTQRTVWRRVFLIAAAILIGVGLNPIRIALIGLWAQRGDAVLHGPFHILQGMFVSVVGFCLLFLLAWFFSERGVGHVVQPATSSSRPHIPLRRFQAALLAAVVILGGTGVWLQAGEPRPVPLAAPLEGLPPVLGEWAQAPEPGGPGFTLEGADESIDRLYRDPSGFRVRLQVGYYAFQRQGKEIVSYRLDELYENARTIEIGSGPGGFAANFAELRRPDGRRIVLFWHHTGGRDVAGILAAKAMSARRWLVERQNNGAVVIVSSEAGAGAGAGGALGRLTDFAALVHTAAALD
ncbi:MAG TPA: exosortase W [Candidatus Methanoperedens sp.]|nr:exosortase W [Candidatus Methanoperedens sp.]